MEALREKIEYRDNPITICMKDFNHMEQYEIFRLILGNNRKDVSICTHDSIIPYLEPVIKKLNVKFTQCHLELPVLQKFDPQVDQQFH